MKISTKGRYGLRAMMELANHYGQGPMPVETIARNQDISGKYIHIIVMDLRSAGLVRSVRGPNGGYELAKTPTAITVLDVISALEGKCIPVECVADTAFCSRAGHCAARDVWCDVASAVDEILSALTLEQLAAKQRSKDEQPPSYHI